MKNLRAIHLYLGCVFAPLLILFTVTGAWQMFDLHQSKKDGSYVAPKILKALSSIHMNQRLPGSPHESGGLLRAFSLVAAIGLVTTTILGIVMA
ncbi:MAG: hypothetical protein JO317_00630, partial [Verrucomicrobiae bacterium]|nr:hypothetical protein [Verrucomicrobiae bacterium]